MCGCGLRRESFIVVMRFDALESMIQNGGQYQVSSYLEFCAAQLYCHDGQYEVDFHPFFFMNHLKIPCNVWIHISHRSIPNGLIFFLNCDISFLIFFWDFSKKKKNNGLISDLQGNMDFYQKTKDSKAYNEALHVECRLRRTYMRQLKSQARKL